MKKIAYIEIDTHAEIAGSFLELTKDSEKLSVDFYFSKRILDLLDLKENQNIFLVTPENILSILKNKNYDLVIIGTAHRYFFVFQEIADRFKTSIIVHNLNFAKTTKWELLKNIFKKETKFRLKLCWKEGLFQKQKVYDKAIIHWVLDENLVVNEKTGIRKKNRFLPIFFKRERENKVADDEVFSMVISGAVSQKRRDYSGVIQKLKNIRLDKKLKVVFLGKAQGEELAWLKDLEQRKLPNLEIVYFEEKVSQKIFDDYMKNAHLLWCPIQEETDFFSVKEIYGKTKMSGNIGDAIKYGKTAIFPKNYQGKYPFVISEEDFFEKLSLPSDVYHFDSFKKEKILTELEKIILNS